jgi:SulP family sulfate permease
MTAIDSTGLQALEKFADRVHESGRQLILCGARQQPEMRMHDAEFHEHVGEENICHSVADALDRAKIVYPEVAKQIPTGPPGAEEVPMNRGGGTASASPHT